MLDKAKAPTVQKHPGEGRYLRDIPLLMIAVVLGSGALVFGFLVYFRSQAEAAVHPPLHPRLFSEVQVICGLVLTDDT